MAKNNLLKLLDGITQDKEEATFNKHDRVLIIDGLNLFLRNFAVLNFVNQEGVHVGGLAGFLRSLGYLIDQTKPTSAYIVFDGVGSSINRKNLLPEYKSNRNITRITNWDSFEDIDEENDAKINQISRLIHYLKCIPIKTISLDKVEADDIISHLSTTLAQQHNSKVFIVSSDKDFLQLIDDNITIFRPIEKEFFTKEVFTSKFEMPPKNFIMYKTLLGDNSDKVPGVKGLGEKGLFKKFPELKEKILSLDDLFSICEAKYKEHVVYSRILFDREMIEKCHKLMDLSRPLVDETEKQIIHDLITNPAPKLEPESFLRMYHEDGLGHVLKDVNWWLRDTFKVLSSFNK